MFMIDLLAAALLESCSNTYYIKKGKGVLTDGDDRPVRAPFLVVQK
jgi:hypothetical protein